MPCYQQVKFVEEAIRSVFEQQGVDFELLVMDPGSTDGTRELLLSLREEYGKRLILCFEPDKGQSDAVNRGFVRSKGVVFAWLNSDDRLRPDAINKVVKWLDSPEPRWLYGQAGMIDEAGKPSSSLIVRYKNWRGRKFSRLKLLTENFIPQMAVFWNRAMWERAGGLDNDLHLDMDYDLWLRFTKFCEPLVLKDVLADFRIHGDAKGSLQAGDQLRAAFATAKKHSEGLGWWGKVALWMHLFLSIRTRLIYFWMKP
jgi:glycosyltransferase involved in cell wall biosynthesis